MVIHLRPVVSETDFVRLAELMSTYYSQPVSVDELLSGEQHLPPGGNRKRVAAVDAGGRIAGFNDCGRWPFMRPGSYWIDIAVDPVLRRRGIGSQLFAQAVEFAKARHASRLEAEVRDRDPAWSHFAAERGFRIERHIFEARLELANYDDRPYSRVIEAVEATGIRFITLAEAGNSPDNQRKLHELARRNSLDIPGHEGTFPSFEEARQAAFEASHFRPDGVFIAADGDLWIGQTRVSYFKHTNSTYTQHTGVDRSYRGRKIALALKVLGIRWSRQIGAAATRTHNDSLNTPILAINRRLGFQSEAGYFRMLRDLPA